MTVINFTGSLRVFAADRFGESNLDHILASTALKFRQFSQGGQTHEVVVDGWNRLTGEAREYYLANISDHCALYCEVMQA